MNSWKPGMPSSPSDEPRARGVRVDGRHLTVELVDGRRLTVPVSWFPRLLEASADERKGWELLGDGTGIRWPELDEDLSVAGLLLGTPGRGRQAG